MASEDHNNHGGPYEELSVEEGGPIPSSASVSHSIPLHGGATELFLFPNVVTSNAEEFFFACLVIILLSFLLEIGRHYASKVEIRLLNSRKVSKRASDPLEYTTFPSLTLQQPNNYQTHPQSTLPKPSGCASLVIRESWLWFLAGFGNFFSHFVSILFMLIAMTYNIYLILSLSFGATCGKLFVIYLKTKEPRS